MRCVFDHHTVKEGKFKQATRYMRPLHFSMKTKKPPKGGFKRKLITHLKDFAQILQL
jgi:hypothetical protein